ncbi:MAG: glycosyltransferase family 39 protein [Candidatus Binatia bacterium]
MTGARADESRPDAGAPNALIVLASTAAGITGALLLAFARPAAGLGLLALSAVLLRWPRSIWSVADPSELAPATRRWLLLGVTAVAAVFRCYRLNPPGLWGDDAVNGLLAFDVLAGEISSPFQIVAHSYSHFHALSNYPIAAAFWLFGPDLWTLRLPGVIMGIAGAPLLYGIVAPLFGARAGLIAALFYACSPPQISHAKQLVQIITGEFFLLAALCLLVQGAARGRRALVVAAAAPLALTVYTYHSARITPLIAVAFLIAWWLRGRFAGAPAGAPAARPARIGIGTALTALTVFALCTVPAVVGYARNPSALVARVSSESIWVAMRQQNSWLPLWDAAWRTAGMFHYQQGPTYHWFGIGSDPAFNPVVGFLFVHGLIASLARWREPRHLLLLTWAILGLVPALLSGGAPRLYRGLYATLPLYVWAALPLAQLLAAGRWQRGVRVLALVLIGAVPLIDSQYYFYRLYTHPRLHWFQAERMVEMARTLRSYGPGWTGYLLSQDFVFDHETLLFLTRAWNLDLRGVASLAEVLPLHPLPERGALFMMTPATLPAAEAIRAFYPSSELFQRTEPTPRSWAFDAYLPIAHWPATPHTIAAFAAVPRAIAEQAHNRPAIGLQADYDLGDRHTRRLEPYPLYVFMPRPFPTRFRTTMRGRLIVPEPGGYRLDVESNAIPRVWLDGRPADLAKELSAGAHDFRLQLGQVEQLSLQMFWQRADLGRTPVPPEAWRPPDDQ